MYTYSAPPSYGYQNGYTPSYNPNVNSNYNTNTNYNRNINYNGNYNNNYSNNYNGSGYNSGYSPFHPPTPAYSQDRYSYQPYGHSGYSNPYGHTAPSYGSSQPSAPTQWQRDVMQTWAHDLYDDGLNNGSVLLKALMNPEDSQNKGLVDTDHGKRAVYDLYRQDLRDDRQINGSSLRNAFGHIYWQVTGHDISQQLASAPYQRADLSYRNIFKTAPNPRTPEGIQQVSKNSGLSVNQLLTASLWGHDFFDKPARNGYTIDGSVLNSALNDPNSIDYGFVHSSPQTEQFVKGLIQKDERRFDHVNGFSLNNAFLGVVSQVYGLSQRYLRG